MFISPDQYETGFYAPLRRAALSGGCSVLVLPTTSVDALCATRMLNSMLEADNIQHKVVPIGGWEDLKKAADQEVAKSQEVKSVVLVGCGSHVNLMEYWAEALESLANLAGSAIDIYVIDSNRPYNLANLFSRASRVTVLDDGDAALLLNADSALPLKEGQTSRPSGLKDAFLDTEFDDEYSDESDSELDEDEEEANIAGEDEVNEESHLADDSLGVSFGDANETFERPRRRRRLDDTTSDDHSPVISRRALRARNRASRERIAKYYTSGTWHGLSASSTIFALASSMQRVDNDLLWLAILGLTSQFFRDEITYTRYTKYAATFDDEVARLNVGLSDTEVRPNDGLVNTLDQNLRSASTFAKPRKANDIAIRTCTDLRFLLQRHWSLAESLLHTPYIASKFSLWSDPGRRRLNRLLAKMGFSTRQCAVPYQFMDIDLKRSLRKKLEDIGAEYELDDLVWSTFERSYGFRGSLCAGDAVSGIEAILACAPEISQQLRKDALNAFGALTNESGKENRRPGSQNIRKDRESQDEADSFEALGEEHRGRHDWWIMNWYRAYDSLQSYGAQKSSLVLAMSLHRRLVAQGISVMEKRSIRRLRTFRLLIMRDITSHSSSVMSSREEHQHNNNVWTNPSMLNKLAMWLFQATKAEAKQILPLVVAVFDEARKCWCVVGVNGSDNLTASRKSHFSDAFNQCADRTGAQVRIDSFETNLIEIAKDDLEPFVEGLVLKT